jgi:ElaB/YqjD/DUF883 family membrane-anchored ribosome-binding protein
MAHELLEKPVTYDDVVREVSRIKSMVSEAVEDGIQSALRAVKQGRDAAEDVVHDARHAIKRNPFQAVGILFAAGILIGSVVTLIASQRD